MKKIGLSLFSIFLALQIVAQEKSYFTNPVIRGDMPDPSMIRIDDTYYATGTSSEWAPFYPVFTSKDLINWKQTGHIFNEQPSWTSNSFWAPELFYHNNKVFCYYTARQKSTGISYIGVAVADSPLHEFKDYGPVVEYGTEAITLLFMMIMVSCILVGKLMGWISVLLNCWDVSSLSMDCAWKANHFLYW